MPLSKKRQAEYQARRRQIVIPKEEIVIPNFAGVNHIQDDTTIPWEITNWASYKGEVVPLPNCKDGRYRDATN